MNKAACDLFDKLFAEVAADPPPESPSYYVPLGVFMVKLKEAGIEAPENVIRFWEWLNESGVEKHITKRITRHHKEHGTDYSPMEKGAMRATRRFRKILR